MRHVKKEPQQKMSPVDSLPTAISPVDPSPNKRSTGPPKPKLRLQINDLRHSGSNAFLLLVPDIASTIDKALADIIDHLYTPPHPQDESHAVTTAKTPTPTFTPSIPPTRSVTFFLRDIGGVAYTTGMELDDDHKEIHLSLQYILTAMKLPDPRAEIVGVLTHELVHCYQHTAPRQDNASVPRPPGGLIEGIADFVRLKAGFVPPHWKRPASAQERAEKWDQGYQHTAFFLEWLEDVRIGKGAVGMLNDRLLRVGYIGESETLDHGRPGFWKNLFGSGVDELWDDYGRYLDRHGRMSTERSGGNWEDEIVNPPE
ncbi:peptidase of plants and bacteria-domain-containing protein [Aspergillus pseudotamarii]|uniref:Peptidase of plants and bacteria-domain-containing protein n=1 Tax=Aspergillus pseudotamarii TaxID=132259 RepID=A0A5N6TAL4_ASPPS|nr:peptidase of plants and bacteria-domain-containing protein [Aspergillus pseudotamarii]KAE8143209.1 peptidase of plants and bacteria-domain-containing protein [Aspergillus pseudotamarii]